MSLKAKLATTIAALCMVICLLSVGVWAAQKGTVSFNGTISFIANDVNVTVDAQITNLAGDDYADYATKTTVADWDANDDTATQDKWADDIIYNFKNKKEAITLVIEIANYNTVRSVKVTPTLKVGETDITTTPNSVGNLTFSYAVEGLTNGEIPKATVADENAVEAGTRKGITATVATYTVTLKITDTNYKVEDTAITASWLIEDVQPE